MCLIPSVKVIVLFIWVFFVVVLGFFNLFDWVCFFVCFSFIVLFWIFVLFCFVLFAFLLFCCYCSGFCAHSSPEGNCWYLKNLAGLPVWLKQGHDFPES